MVKLVSTTRGAGLAAALLLIAGSMAVPAFAKDAGGGSAGAAGGTGAAGAGDTSGAAGATGSRTGADTAGAAGTGTGAGGGAAGTGTGSAAAAGDAGAGTDAAAGSESGGGPSPDPTSGRGLTGRSYEGSETGATTVERPTNLYGVAAAADRQPLDADQLQARLQALGFTEVGQLRETAGTFQTDAEWRGEEVVVVVDPETGALSYEDDAVAKD